MRLSTVLSALFSFALFSLASLATRSALAAPFEVSPVLVALDSAAKTQSVALRNLGHEPLRLQVSVFEWKQSPSGEMLLAPTEDVVFYPSLLVVPAGDVRSVRFGATSLPGVEHGYRAFIEELPKAPVKGAPAGGAGPTGIDMRTRVGIPIFLQAKPGTALPVISDLQAAPGVFGFALRNDGDKHTVGTKVALVGHARDGHVTFERDVVPWYVLARGKRTFFVEIPARECKETAAFEVRSETSDGLALARFDQACVPGP